jgi:hypothetical protein
MTDRRAARGIVLTIQFLILEFEKAARILTESSVVKVASPRTLTFPWMEIVWSLIIGS